MKHILPYVQALLPLVFFLVQVAVHADDNEAERHLERELRPRCPLPHGYDRVGRSPCVLCFTFHLVWYTLVWGETTAHFSESRSTVSFALII